MSVTEACPGHKACSTCKAIFPLDGFHKNKNAKDGRSVQCKSCATKKSLAHYRSDRERKLKVKKSWADRNKMENSRKQRERNLKNRMVVLAHYSGGTPHCAGCGIMNVEALTVDHINEDGASHRKALNSACLYGWLVREKMPEGFQILCWNCNRIKHQQGVVRAVEFLPGFTSTIQYPKEQ